MTAYVLHGVLSYASMLSNVIAIANGKGGVGKTALTANVAGALAAADNDVLAVDLDRQGNLELDLGYRDGRSDEGRAMTAALESRTPLTGPGIAAVRPRLDVVPGGGALARVTERCEPDALTAALSDLYWQYHVVLLDCPPAAPMMGLAFRTARLGCSYQSEPTPKVSKDSKSPPTSSPKPAKPTRSCGCSESSPSRCPAQRNVSDGNYTPGSKSCSAGVAPVFATGIRDAPRAAWDTAEWGQLATDYEAMYRTKGVSVAARGLADDYHKVSQEIIERIADAAPTEGNGT